ncbi:MULTISPECIES: iron-containing alcohol dehydrogenase [unclassified Polaribacter]|jgi:NADP-dependent alcohol dehydrogenase|uniref:iron-containing alcohol dehydrogenase n=1 Tax=unclassified Polaribacter TaxID=196858 RepID=UPI001C4FEF77|nr:MULTISPECIES: iron-containing alcohol dehydrogenase [unclassified Polaribacter]QXP62133.1 iron-containing alcohol dehydrogenase [Polaribacter sp. HaHaR_3_91]QXP67891.1 iron-containing alcohol dehydrogenase [Polaribacter sp. AHE13PA]
MNNFELKNPTKIIFGKDTIKQLETEIPADAKVLLLYGGGSIKKNGIYDQVKKALANIEVVEFGGIPANPEYATLMEALNVIKEEQITYLLAVGGGSVIDGTKFLSAAAVFEGETPWDILTNNVKTEKGMPFGTVLTLPATGSEMNSGAVITRRETKEKLAMGGPGLFPVFSILDPQVIASIPQRQLQNGLMDSFTHVLEQYMTYPVNGLLQDRFAESILQTIIEIAPKVLKDPTNYDAAANFMWSCTMALNGLIQKGVPGDWAVHAMGHELTALFGIDHARTLAIITPSHYKYNFDAKKEKLAQYGERVWKIKEGSKEDRAYAAIEKTVAFFHKLGIETKLSDYTDNYEGTAEEIAKRFTDRGWLGLGEHQNLSPEKVKEIVKMAY